jgi:hypothetical protein
MMNRLALRGRRTCIRQDRVCMGALVKCHRYDFAQIEMTGRLGGDARAGS